MDLGQFSQFLIGSALALKKSKDARTIQNASEDFLAKAIGDRQKGTSLRTIIESHLPVIYVLNCDTIIANMVEGMRESRLSGKYDDYIFGVVTDEGTIFSIDKEFNTLAINKILQFETIYSNTNSTEYRELHIKLHKSLTTKFSTTLNTKRFARVVIKTLRRLNNLAATAVPAAVSSGITIDPETATRDLGTKFRQDIQILLPARLDDATASNILDGYQTGNHIVVLVDSYPRAVKLVNEALLDDLRKALENLDVVAAPDFAAGSFSAAGHTGVIVKEGGVTEVVGINTPLTQRILVASLAEQSPQRVNFNNFVLNTDHVNYSVSINRKYSVFAQILLSMNFSVMVPMVSYYNSTKLVDQETREADKAVQAAFSKTRQQLYNSWQRLLSSRQVLRTIFSGLRFSPTLKEVLSQQFNDILKTGKTKTVTGTNILKKQGSGLKKVSSTLNTKLNSSINKAKVPPTKKISQTFTKPKLDTTPVSLLNLLQANLVEQVKRNMGSGNRRDILNLQSGRFAESVMVTKVSRGRQGMITAFYSYMRNPYATFSTGGKQEYPRTRDPKLLIAKSIRELAKQQMITKIRAVER